MFPLFHVLYSISIHNKFFCTSHDKSIPCWSSKHLIWHYGTNFEKSTTTLRVWRGVNKKWSQQLPLLPCIPPLTRQHEDSLFYPSLASVQPTILLPSSSLVYIRKKHKTWTQRGNYGYVDISALDKIAQCTLVYDRIPNIRPNIRLNSADIIRPNIRPRWPNSR